MKLFKIACFVPLLALSLFGQGSIPLAKFSNGNINEGFDLPSGKIVSVEDGATFEIENGGLGVVRSGGSLDFDTGATIGVGGSILSTDELSYLDGVTSSIQTQFSAKQPIDVTLTAWADVSFNTAGQVGYATGADAFTTITTTSFGRSLWDDADAAAARNTLGAVGTSSVGDVAALQYLTLDTYSQPMIARGTEGNTLTIWGGYDTSIWPRNSSIRFLDNIGDERGAIGYNSLAGNPSPTVFADAFFIELSGKPNQIPWASNTTPPGRGVIVQTGYLSSGSGAEIGYNTRLKQLFSSNGDISFHGNSGGAVFTIPGLSGSIVSDRTLFTSGQLQSAGGRVLSYLPSAGTPVVELRRSDVNMSWLQELLPVGSNYDFRIYGSKAGASFPGVLRAGMDGGIVLGSVSSTPTVGVVHVAYTTEQSGTTASLTSAGGIYAAKKIATASTFEGSGANLTGITAAQVANTPAGSVAATTTQAAINELDAEKSPLAGSSSLTTVGIVTTGTWNASAVGSSYGGAGAVNGLLKANGSGTVSAAVAGTDYLAPAGSGAALTGITAGQVANTPAGSIAATTTQAAINELDAEKSPLAGSTSITTVGTITNGIWNTTVVIPTTLTVATLPTPPSAGYWSAVTDALAPTYGATVVGGGAVVTPVWYDGTNWTCR